MVARYRLVELTKIVAGESVAFGVRSIDFLVTEGSTVTMDGETE